jgi:hypothetical protein
MKKILLPQFPLLNPKEGDAKKIIQKGWMCWKEAKDSFFLLLGISA